jgi:hypothetical protein
MKKYPLWLLMLLAACSGDAPVVPTRYEVPAALEKYLQRFAEEGQQRGVTVRLENLIVKFQTINSGAQDACGSCTQASRTGQRTVLLSEGELCWKVLSEPSREALVFHELGHCLLQRSHRDDLLPGGDPASLMNARPGSIYEACAYPIGNDPDCDQRYRRTYYLDELFNPKTPPPAWGK